MCIIWLASFFNEASIVLKDTDKCFKRENSFNFMSTCHTNVFKEEIKKKMDPLITSKWVYFINSWISNMNNLGCKMRKNPLEETTFFCSHSKLLWRLIFCTSLYPRMHCKVIIGRNPIEANANTVAIQLPGNPVAYIGKCFTPY